MEYKTDSAILKHITHDLLPTLLNKYYRKEDWEYKKWLEFRKELLTLIQRIENGTL